VRGEAKEKPASTKYLRKERGRRIGWLLLYIIAALVILEVATLIYSPVERDFEVAQDVPRVRSRLKVLGLELRNTPQHCSLAADYEELIGPLPEATRWRSYSTQGYDLFGNVSYRACGNADALNNYEYLSLILRERLQGAPWIITSSGLSKPAAKKVLSEFMALAKQKGAEHTDCASYLQAVVRVLRLVPYEVREVDVPTTQEVLDLSIWQRDWEPRILQAERGL
jgi:hypothetical protein